MKITISGMEQELVAFIKNFDNSEIVMNMIITNDTVEKSVEFDDPIIAGYFERISWATFHLAKVIWEKAGEQTDRHGSYLTVEQLEKLGIGERTASGRVGGSRKVCGDLEIEDILFLKNMQGAKRYYVRPDAIPTLMQCLNKYEQGYKDYLEELEDRNGK